MRVWNPCANLFEEGKDVTFVAVETSRKHVLRALTSATSVVVFHTDCTDWLESKASM